VFAQQLTNGLVLGSIYALCALGFTLIFGVARVVNFAYGELLMLGAFVTLSLMTGLDIGFFSALPIGMLAIAALVYWSMSPRCGR
jgi:branched-chain amino acid transport system permease protein